MGPEKEKKKKSEKMYAWKKPLVSKLSSRILVHILNIDYGLERKKKKKKNSSIASVVWL